MGLVGWWKLNGDATDSSGNNNHGSGSITYTSGKLGQARNTGYITVPADPAFNVKGDMTISFWFKPNTNNARRVVMQTAYAGSFCINHETEGDLRFYNGNNSSYTSIDSSTLTNGVWYHCVIVREGTSRRWYLNGSLDISGSSAYDGGTRQDNLTIGFGYTNNQIDGSLDDVRIYNHALSIKEIRELSKAKVLHYTFDDFQEPVVNEFYENWDDLLSGAYGVLQGVDLDPFGGTDFEVYRNSGKIRFGVTNGTDIGTLYAGRTYTFSIYLKHVFGETEMVGGEFDICDRADSRSYTGTLAENMTYYWKKFSVTAYHNNSASYHFIDVGVAGGVYDWSCPQIEEKSYSTPFTPSPRKANIIDSSGQNNHALFDGPIIWGTSSGVSIDGNTITKTGTTSLWDSGALSQQQFGDDCFVEWRMTYVDSTHGAEMMGLNYNHSIWSYTDIDYAIYTHYDGNIRIYENGAIIGIFSSWDLTYDNNLFRIEVRNGTVYYYHNGSLMRSRAITHGSNPLYADCSMHSHGAPNKITAWIGNLPSTKIYPKWSTASIKGSGTYEFDGTKQHVIAPYNTSDSYTVVFWAKSNIVLPSTTSSADRRTPLKGNGQWNPGIWLTFSMIRAHATTKYADISWTGDTNWHQIGQMFDASSNTLRVILDGQLLAGTETSYAPGNPTEIIIGNESIGGTTYPWDGLIDDVRFYATALSADDVREIYEIGMQMDSEGNLWVG